MKPQAFDAKKVIIDPVYRTRSGEPDAKKVKQFLESMASRHEKNLPPQIQNGVVRPNKDNPEAPYLVDGEHRLLSIIEFNKILHKAGEEPIPFYAVVEQDKGQLEAIETGVRSNIRAELDLLDESRSMTLLSNPPDGSKGMTLAEIAKMFDCSIGAVSDRIAVGKLPKKIQDRIGKSLTYEAAVVLAHYNNDPQLQEDLLEMSKAERDTLDAIAERAEARAKAAKEESKEEGKEGKSSTPAAKKAVAKKKSVKGKITAKDVKAAVAQKGVQKRKKDEDESVRNKTYTQFFKLVEDKEWQKGLPQPALDLLGKLEEWFENECGDQSLHNSLVKFCKGSTSTAKAAA